MLTNNCNTHIANISRSKDNQSMKFGHLIECNTRKKCLEKSCTKCDGETTPRPFYKKSKLSIFLLFREILGHVNQVVTS